MLVGKARRPVAKAARGAAHMNTSPPELSAPPSRIGRGRADNSVRGGVLVRGNATPEEVAAVLAVVATRSGPAPDAYTRWRQGRLAALRGGPKN